MTIKLGFGKHADDDIENVPESYLKWLVQNSQEKIDIANSELARRMGKFSNSWMVKIINEGYDALAQRITPEELVTCTKARDALLKAVLDAAKGTSQ